MVAFNKFPVRRVTTESTASPFLAPQLVREPYPTAAIFPLQANSNRYEGFVGDKDYIELPINSAGNIEYFNSAEVSQFTVNLTAIAPTSDDWGGFTFDKTDALIYVVVVDEGTAPNTYFFASVNVSGTVVNIGNAQPGVEFATASGNWYNTSASDNGSSTIQRAADGSGNMFMRQTNVTGMEEMEINISTGAIVSDPAVIDTDIIDVAWKTSDGNYYSIDSVNAQRFRSPVTGTLRAFTDSAQNFGWIGVITQKVIQWKGRAVETDPASSTNQASRLSVKIKTLDTWVADVIETYGF